MIAGPTNAAQAGDARSAQPPTAANLNGVAKFYFASAPSENARPRIWSVDADGTHLQAVAPLGSQAPDITSDGKRLAYEQHTNASPFGPSHLVVANVNGTRPRSITSRSANDYAYTPAWSANGREILYGRGPGGPGTGIYRINADGSRRRAVPDSAEGTEPVWISATRLSYIVGEARCCRGYTIDVNGRQKRAVGGPRLHRNPDVSPDGRTLVWTGEAAGSTSSRFKTQLWTQSVSGGLARALPATAPCAGSPRWSPDGTVIFYSQCRRDAKGQSISNRDRIMAIAANGSGRPRVVMPVIMDISQLAIVRAPTPTTPVPTGSIPAGSVTTPGTLPSATPKPVTSPDSSSGRGLPIALAAVLLTLVATGSVVSWLRVRRT